MKAQLYFILCLLLHMTQQNQNWEDAQVNKVQVNSTECVCSKIVTASSSSAPSNASHDGMATLHTAKKRGFDDNTIDKEDENVFVASYLHPLDPLTPMEILKTREIIAKTVQYINIGRLKFNTISLKEPPKADLLPYFLNNSVPPKEHLIPRKSFTLLIEEGTGFLYEAIVNLDSGRLEILTEIPPTFRPPSDAAAVELVFDVVKSDPIVQERCEKLGFPDMDLVVVEAMVLHTFGGRYEKYGNLTRPYQSFMYGRNFPGDNYYAHPFDFVVIVDEAETHPYVAGIEELPTHDSFDYGTLKAGNKVPKAEANFNADDKFKVKGDKPVMTQMPEGASFSVEGRLIKWQKFSMRLGPREGVVLHNIGYTENDGSFHPIIYRASLSEVATLYGDPRQPFHKKYAFDQGEIGFGFAATPLVDQADCVGSTHFFDVTTSNATGHPNTVSNGICISEDDAGILWKHAPNKRGPEGNVVVRSHRLNIMLAANFGNYDYLVTWSFHQDASISLKTQLTGILSTNMLAVGSTPGGYGTIVAPQINAQFHQHIFAVRLDFEIDGNSNTVHTTEAVSSVDAAGSRANPMGQGFKAVQRTVREACSHVNPWTGKTWIVSNPSKLHPFTKKPVGWKVIPIVDGRIMMKRQSPIYKQMGFVACDVWVTKYAEDQLFAGGYYLNNSGLPEWVRRGGHEKLEDTDLVLWHVFNPIHMPRVEDYPVMPVESREMWIKPYNFFTQNPSLNP